MREKCTYADRYQARRPPTCGCRQCNEMWQIAVARKVMEDDREVLAKLAKQ